MAKYINPITEQVYNLLNPLVGDFMARGVIKSQAAALGANEDSITKRDLPALAEGIRKGLGVFVGSDASQKIATKILSIN